MLDHMALYIKAKLVIQDGIRIELIRSEYLAFLQGVHERVFITNMQRETVCVRALVVVVVFDQKFIEI